jgi:hypothetical protein
MVQTSLILNGIDTFYMIIERMSTINCNKHVTFGRRQSKSPEKAGVNDAKGSTGPYRKNCPSGKMYRVLCGIFPFGQFS